MNGTGIAVAGDQLRSKYLMEGWSKRIKKLESATGKKNSLERNLCLAYTLNNTKIQRDLHESIQTPDAGNKRLALTI